MAETWGRFDLDKVSLSRRLVLDLVSPRMAVVRANMIENVSQRATPKQATVYVDVTVDDRDYFSTARSSALMSLILMCGVLCLQVFCGRGSEGTSAGARTGPGDCPHLVRDDPSEPDRASRPVDLARSAIRHGQLAIGASVLPSLALALAFGFEPSGVAADLWAGGCILAQFLFLVVMNAARHATGGGPGS